MNPSSPSDSGVSLRIGRTTARCILAALSLLLLAGLWRPLERHGTAIPEERTDSALFEAVIGRVAAGEPYYKAMGTELRARGYPSASVFNWRMPTLIIGLARTPILMRVVLVLLVVAAIAGTVMFFARSTTEVMLLAVLAQVGASASALGALSTVAPEPWAGLCIAVSALLYARGRPLAGATVGSMAFFLRELVAPYAAVCLWIAVREKRGRELMIWTLVGLSWSVFYLFHILNAVQSMQPGDLAHPSWVQFGGLRFVLATIGFGGWLSVLPTWVATIGGVLLVASAWGPRRAPHLKAGIAAYLLFFLVVGQPFNQYWGLLAAPVWAIGFGLGAEGLVRLIRESFAPLPSPVSAATGSKTPQ